MATNLANLLVPSVMTRYIGAQLEKANAVVASGAAIASPQMATLLAGGAGEFTLPFWNNISATALVPSTDTASVAGSQRLAAGAQKAVRVVRALTPVAVADLEGVMIGEDPVAAAAAQFANAHATIRQAVLMGMISAVVAADTAALTATDAATSFSSTVLLTGIQSKWGDSVRGLAGLTIFAPSSIYLTMQLDQLTAGGIAIKNAVDVGFGTYHGATVIVDDDVPAKTVYVVRQGGLAFGTAALPVNFEVERVAGAGNGGGASVVHSRDCFGYHIYGAKWKGTPAGELATNAEIATAANWDLVKPAKYCGVLAVVHA